MKNIIVITGASSGFGSIASHALARAGYTVYAGMRETRGRNAPQVEEADRFSKGHGVDLRTVEMDVSNQPSEDAAIKAIIEQQGHIDVLIHNAGHMVFGPAEAFTPEQLAELYDINVLSTQRVNRAVLPYLRKQRKGLVLWVSSSSSAGGTPPTWHPTSPRRQAWMQWRSYTLASSSVGVSRARSSCPARSRVAPTISPTPRSEQSFLALSRSAV
jgi:NAD(P)-dependent dehydrogenase (short-subunit alcohol dehydrogenase family)